MVEKGCMKCIYEGRLHCNALKNDTTESRKEVWGGSDGGEVWFRGVKS